MDFISSLFFILVMPFSPPFVFDLQNECNQFSGTTGHAVAPHTLDGGVAVCYARSCRCMASTDSHASFC